MVMVAGALIVVLPPLARMGQEGYCENSDPPSAPPPGAQGGPTTPVRMVGSVM
jgi:hypothetical protein